MNEYMLHILAPSRQDGTEAIVGDLSALHELRDAIDEAIRSGTGGAFVTQSDGEGYALGVVRMPDMLTLFTAYADEVAPERSEREMVDPRSSPRFMEALQKSYPARWIGRQLCDSCDRLGEHNDDDKRQDNSGDAPCSEPKKVAESRDKSRRRGDPKRTTDFVDASG